MTFQPWILEQLGNERERFLTFNGAMTFQPWIHRSEADRTGQEVPPSMEPCPFSHGYNDITGRTSRAVAPFNGAMTFQPWIHRNRLKQREQRLPSMEP